MDEKIEKIKTLISNNKIDKAIEELLSISAKNESTHKLIQLLKGQFSSLKEKRTKGTIQSEEDRIRENQIRDELLKLTNISKLRESSIQEIENRNLVMQTKENIFLKLFNNRLIKIGLLIGIISFVFYLCTQTKELNDTQISTRKNIVLLGSGTTLNYLQKNNAEVFELDSINITPLESPSGSAIDVLNYSYQRGDEGKYHISLIGMASMHLTEQKLSKEDIEQKLFYCFQIAWDTLQISIGYKNLDSLNASDEAFLQKNIYDVESINPRTLIDILKINGLSTYTTVKNSGTYNSYQAMLNPYNLNLDSIEAANELNPFDQSLQTRSRLKNSKYPWIILGSRYYNLTKKDSIFLQGESFKIKKINIIDTDTENYRRPLQLYGRIYNTNIQSVKSSHYYELDEEVCLFWRKYFEVANIPIGIYSKYIIFFEDDALLNTCRCKLLINEANEMLLYRNLLI